MTTKKKRRLKLSTAIILFISAFTILISAILGTVLTLHSIDKMKKMVSSKAIEFAVTAAALLDGDSLKGMQESDIGSEAYNNAYNTLKAFVNSNEETSGELAFVYLCRHKGGDEYEFTIDPSNDPAEFGEYLEKTGALESAANGVAKFDSESYTDRWGTFYSAYAPVFDSTKTEVTMIVGIDVWADWYNNTVYSNSIYIAIVSAVAGLSGTLLGLIINARIRKRFRVLSEELNTLENDIQVLLHEIKEPIDTIDEEEILDMESKDQVLLLRERIHASQKEIKEYILYTKKQAFLDALTKVGNRTAYIQQIKNIDFDYPFAVAIFDINGLKYINDTYGHEVGDNSITATAKILKEIFHEENIYRIGGDEFVVVLPENDKDTTIDNFNSFPEALNKYNELKELPFTLFVSKGIAFYEKGKDKTYKDVFNRADEEMYKDKEAFYEKHPKIRKKYYHE